MSAYTPNDAIALVKDYVKGIPVSTTDSANLCDMVNSLIWNYYPWRWSIGNLTISLTDGTQDYTSVPADYFRLIRARIARTDTSPNQYNEVIIRRSLAKELVVQGGMYSIEAVSFEPQLNSGAGGFRLSNAMSIASGSTYELQGEYQVKPTKIGSGQMATAFAFPDQYFPVFVYGIMWKLFVFSNDQRAGTVQMMRDGSRQYSGMIGMFYNTLQDMVGAEEFGAGDAYFPSDSLGAVITPNPGLFGW